MLVNDEDQVLEFEKDANLETIRCYSTKIADNIEYSWGYPECKDYMLSIRKQFNIPKELATAVYNLMQIHGKV